MVLLKNSLQNLKAKENLSMELSKSTNPFNPFDPPFNQSPIPMSNPSNTPLVLPPWDLSTHSPNPPNPIILLANPKHEPSTSITHPPTKDVIHWLLAKNKPSLCHQTSIPKPTKEPSNVVPICPNPSCSPQPIEESLTMSPSQGPSFLHVIDHLEHTKPL